MPMKHGHRRISSKCVITASGNSELIDDLTHIGASLPQVQIGEKHSSSDSSFTPYTSSNSSPQIWRHNDASHHQTDAQQAFKPRLSSSPNHLEREIFQGMLDSKSAKSEPAASATSQRKSSKPSSSERERANSRKRAELVQQLEDYKSGKISGNLAQNVGGSPSARGQKSSCPNSASSLIPKEKSSFLKLLAQKANKSGAAFETMGRSNEYNESSPQVEPKLSKHEQLRLKLDRQLIDMAKWCCCCCFPTKDTDEKPQSIRKAGKLSAIFSSQNVKMENTDWTEILDAADLSYRRKLMIPVKSPDKISATDGNHHGEMEKSSNKPTKSLTVTNLECDRTIMAAQAFEMEQSLRGIFSNSGANKPHHRSSNHPMSLIGQTQVFLTDLNSGPTNITSVEMGVLGLEEVDPAEIEAVREEIRIKEGFDEELGVPQRFWLRAERLQKRRDQQAGIKASNIHSSAKESAMKSASQTPLDNESLDDLSQSRPKTPSKSVSIQAHAFTDSEPSLEAKYQSLESDFTRFPHDNKLARIRQLDDIDTGELQHDQDSAIRSPDENQVPTYKSEPNQGAGLGSNSINQIAGQNSNSIPVRQLNGLEERTGNEASKSTDDQNAETVKVQDIPEKDQFFQTKPTSSPFTLKWLGHVGPGTYL